MNKHLGLILMSLAAMPLAAQQTSGTIGSYELSPAAGEVEELQSVKITFPDLGYMWLATPDCSSVTLTSGSGTVYKVVKTEGDWENYCTMYFSSGSEAEIITTPDTYKLSIPQGVFKQDFSEDKYNDLIEAEYVIEAIVPNTLDSYTITPADGEVMRSIEAVTITFADAAATGVDAPQDLSQITMEYDGTTYVCVLAEAIGNNSFALKFGTAAGGEAVSFKRPGEYKLFIPKKAFTATGTEEHNNYRVEATYTIDNPDFDPMANVVSEPAQGVYLPEFKTVKLTFPEADKGLDYPSDLSAIKLTINGEPTDYLAGNVTMASPYNNVSFGFSAEQYGEPVTFTQEGTYTITIPAGTLKESGSDLYKNHDITLTFNVGEEPNPFKVYESVPADGATIGEIFMLTVKFPELAETHIQWPYDISKVTLQRAGDETVYTGNTTTLGNGCEVTTGFSTPDEIYSNPLHFRTPGEYTVTIPAGTFACEADPTVTNKEIVLHYTVDATYNFTCSLSPDPAKAVSSLEEIVIDPTDVLTSISAVEGAAEQAVLKEADGRSIKLLAVSNESNVSLIPESKVEPGVWTLTIPSGILSAVNQDGLEIVNALPITAVYTVKQPQVFTYSTSPKQDEVIPMFTKYTVTVKDSPKKVQIAELAGMPMLTGAGTSYELTAATASKDVLFAIKGGATLPDGEYTVTIPAGFIVATDSEGLLSPMPEIKGSFKVQHPEKADYAQGMLLYNEGWYGHDMASFSHIAADGTATYNVFENENPDKSLGLTGTWASRFGDKLYAVSKQSGTNLSGVEGGVLTQMDGASLAFAGNVISTMENNQCHAFCGVDSEKGYLSTSTGIYPVDLTTMTLGDRIAATVSAKLKYGEMLRYRGRVFAAVQNWAPLAIDPATDTYTELEIGSIVTSFVTADGSLYMATTEEGREFAKVDPETLSCELISLDGGEYTGRMRVANVWETWRPTPLAVDLKENVVYYATEFDTPTIARADLESGQFTPDFIKLPSTENGQQCIYGQGISIDPATGEIVLTAVEEGYGNHYKQNFIYRADPVTGQIKEEKTIKLSEYFWFPSMMVYGGFTAPELDFSDVNVAEGDVTLNLRDHTTLALGNKQLVEYTVSSSDPEICSVSRKGPAEYLLSRSGEGTAVITVEADFQGLTATAEFSAVTTGLDAVDTEQAPADVYTTTGILVLKQADAAAIRNLPTGIYISNGRKIMVR